MAVKVIVAFSGGKDSQASLIWAVNKYGAKNILAVFCDTGWEHELTYIHIHEICRIMGVELITLKPKYTFVELAVKKGRFPSTKARFCTEELKSKPMIDYVLSQKQHCIIVQGIRKDESTSRSKMLQGCKFFKYYFQPYVTNSMIVETLGSREKLTPVQKTKLKKAKDRLELGKEDAKYHTYRKEEVFAWCKEYADDIWRPVFDKTGQEVIDMILQADQKPNPLYYMASERVGCYPCIMSNHGEVSAMVKYQPKYTDRLNGAEVLVGRSFFPPNYIPKRFQTGLDEKTGKCYPTSLDVYKYLSSGDAQVDMFDEPGTRSCMSYYGICE